MYVVGCIRSRKDFGKWMKDYGLIGAAVEVGTHRGIFATEFLTSWPGKLFCVDPWSAQEGYEEQAKGLYLSTGDRNRDFEAARTTLEKISNRVFFLQTTSEQAVKIFTDESLDFVYIDANHHPEHITKDLRRWWPKLRFSGVLAGHDIVCPLGIDNWGWSIQPAVEEFSVEMGVDVHLVPEPNGSPWSYYMIRPVPKGGTDGGRDE